MRKLFLLITVFLTGISAQHFPGPSEIFRQPPFYGDAPEQICWSPGDSAVAFLWNKNGYPDGDIWLARIPSAKLRQITHFNDDGGGHPLTELQWFPDRQRLLFVRNGDIYTLQPGTQDEPLALTITPSPELFPRISPAGRYVSFIRDNTLRLIDVKAGREIQLSEDISADWHGLGLHCRDNRRAPYCWLPDESALVMPAYEGHLAGHLYRFDLANQETALIPLSGAKKVLVRDIICIPGKNLLAVDYLAEDLDARTIVTINLQSVQVDTIYHYQKDLWCSNFGAQLFWLNSREKLLFGDLQNGYQHIFITGLDHKAPIAITRGKWHVFDYHVNPADDQLYFSANKDDYHEKQIYTIDQKTDKVLNLSYLRGCHDFVLSATGGYIVDIFSTPSTPPQLYLTRTFPVSKAKLFIKPDSRIPNADHLNTALDRAITDPVTGWAIHYRLWYPSDRLGADKYPLILFLNRAGGPVNWLHEWKISNLISQWLSSRGYVVAEIDIPALALIPYLNSTADSLAPWNRQLQQIGAVINELGQKEFIDMSRIGVSGFGYSGYLSIMALLNAPEYFNTGVAVTLGSCWEPDCSLYEQILYAQIRKRNLSPKLASPETVSRLRGKLLLFYGENPLLMPLVDSAALIRQMVEHEKRIDFIHYPWEHTIINTAQTYVDLFYKLLEYFDRFL